jgi:AcrR family transcriptional regulator
MPILTLVWWQNGRPARPVGQDDGMTDLTPVRRPRDRKQRILVAAATLFADTGYHQAGMTDLAAAVGIGPSALYRHFRGKQDLLTAVLREALDQLELSTATASTLDALIAGSVEFALEHREFGALWDREARNLPDADRAEVKARLRAVIGRGADLITTTDPRFRSHALFAVADSLAHHSLKAPPDLFAHILRRAAASVIDVALPGIGPAEPAAGDPQQPTARREVLLAGAVRMFAERGYPAVTLAEVGEATGITGPSVYNHFPSKVDLLVHALARGSESVWLSLHQALRAADGPADALDRAMTGYVSFAVQNPDLITVLLAEGRHLPADEATRFRATQREYALEWVALLRRARPGLESVEASTLVHAALAVVNALARARRFTTARGLEENLLTLAHAITRTEL